MKAFLFIFLALYAFNGMTSAQPTEVKLIASDGAESDNFGDAVSISGDIALVGALHDDAGSAYIFSRNQGGANNWGQVAKLTAADAAEGDLFSISVSVSGDTALVGALRDDDGGFNSGSAYIFSRDHGGANNWGQVAKLTAADAAVGDLFGRSVSVSGDTALVGALLDDDDGPDSGSAYIFSRDHGGANNWGQVAKLTAADAAEGDVFGVSVSVNGDTALIGASRDDDAGSDSGSAYIFSRDHGGANNWGQVAKLTAADNDTADDRFGSAVSTSGDIALVGAYFDDDAGFESGSAYIFSRNQGGANNWGQVAKLTAADAAVFAYFGGSVSVSGDIALVGAAFDSGVGPESGSAYIFSRNQGGADNWGQVAKLTATDIAAFDLFGSSVSVSGSTALVGAVRDDDNGFQSGSAYIIIPNTTLFSIPVLDGAGLMALVLLLIAAAMVTLRKRSGVRYKATFELNPRRSP